MSGTTTKTTPAGVPFSSLPKMTEAVTSGMLFAVIDGVAYQLDINVIASFVVSNGAIAEALAQMQVLVQEAQNAAKQARNAVDAGIENARGAANGIAALDENGNLIVGGKSLVGVQNGLVIQKLPRPTTDPMVSGAEWNNGGFTAISDGPTS